MIKDLRKIPDPVKSDPEYQADNAAPLSLENGNRVIIVGGGPAGAFFAIHLLKEARKKNLSIDVDIIEKKIFRASGDNFWTLRMCNYGAGVISPGLNRALAEQNIVVPEEVVQEEIGLIWIQERWKNIPIKVPDDKRMYSVFRGVIPKRPGVKIKGFDTFLLEEAEKEGANIVSGNVLEIEYGRSGRPELTVQHGKMKERISADFAAVSTGVNIIRGQDYQNNRFIQSIKKINQEFEPAQSRKAVIFELDVGKEFISRHFNQQVYYMEYGSEELSLEHVAIVPKDRFVTVTLIGKGVDRVDLPSEAREIAAKFLSMPHVMHLLPSNAPLLFACSCSPRIAIVTAKHFYADRFAIIGDAVGSRLNKDGLYSAFETAQALAVTIVNKGIDKENIKREYGALIKWLDSDNQYGRWVFGITKRIFQAPVLSRMLYHAFANELKEEKESGRPVGKALWFMASGIEDYKTILKLMCSWSSLKSILIGGVLVTLRNAVIEKLLGLNWRRYGRYPTIIVKEKWNQIRDRVYSRIGLPLSARFDYEKMYIIKIIAPPEEIFNDLKRLGNEDNNLLNMKFMNVTRIAGEPNKEGSVLQYRINLLRLSINLNLANAENNQYLVYEANSKTFDNGRLIFDVRKTRDGNSSLVVYASFDFKKGRTFVGKTVSQIFRILFPRFLHDVIWNHALCSIKNDIEGRHTGLRGRQPKVYAKMTKAELAVRLEEVKAPKPCLQQKTLLVTGANGLVGKNIVRYFGKRGYRIITLDRSVSTKEISFDSRVINIRGDVENIDNLSDLFAKEQIDLIIHLAATLSGSVHDFNRSKHSAVILGQFAAKHKIPLVYSSSSSIYGLSIGKDIDEKTIPQPSNLYSIAKHHIEEELKELGRKEGLKYFVLRLPIVYGRGGRVQGFATLLSLMWKNMVPAMTTIPRRKGLTYHTYADAATSIPEANDFLFNHSDEERVYGQVFNIGEGPVSLRSVIKEAKQIMNKRMPFDIAVPYQMIKMFVGTYQAVIIAINTLRLVHVIGRFFRIIFRKTVKFPIEFLYINRFYTNTTYSTEKIDSLGFKSSSPGVVGSLKNLIPWFAENRWRSKAGFKAIIREKNPQLFAKIELIKGSKHILIITLKKALTYGETRDLINLAANYNQLSILISRRAYQIIRENDKYRALSESGEVFDLTIINDQYPGLV